jgi:hypothetical protein
MAGDIITHLHDARPTNRIAIHFHPTRGKYFYVHSLVPHICTKYVHNFSHPPSVPYAKPQTSARPGTDLVISGISQIAPSRKSIGWGSQTSRSRNARPGRRWPSGPGRRHPKQDGQHCLPDGPPVAVFRRESQDFGRNMAFSRFPKPPLLLRWDGSVNRAPIYDEGVFSIPSLMFPASPSRLVTITTSWVLGSNRETKQPEPTPP